MRSRLTNVKMKKLFALMMLLLCIMTRLSADEVALTISKKLSNSSGPATTTVGDITFQFTGDGTSYQNAYVKMVNGSALTVSTSNGTITKIVIDYATERTKTNSFTANPGTWDDKTSTWTGSSNSVTLTAGDNGECSVSSVTVTYSSNSSLTFDLSQQTASMTDLGVKALKPNNTTNNVTYTSSNTKIAQVDGNGWIRFVNTGMTTITATDTITNKSGSYTLLVTAQEATTSVSGKTYTLTSDGKISNKHILDVPYMNMQVGQDGEMTMARSYGTNNYLGMTCLDRNGFVHVFVDNGLPTMGTYYIFKPSAKGKLTVNGVFFQNGTGTADAHIYEGTTQKGTISYKANYDVATGSFELDAGKTYYLYVPTDANAKNYDIFCLNSFTFESQYYFANKSVRVNNGDKNYTQAVTGGDGSNYTVKAYGSLTSAKVDKSGKVSWSGDGGALVVTASLNGSSDSYVITVPYSEHEWDFRKPNVKLEDLNANTTDWAVTYKVRQFDQTSKALTYLNVPVMANGTAIDGNNALYVPATAGLLFKSNANGFGSKITSWTDDLDIDGLTLDEQYALTYDKVSGVQLVTMYKGGVLTIPNLKKGQYIRMKWRRYSPNTGDHIKAKNVTDLDGKSIDIFNVGKPARADKGDYGYEFFIVKSDGDVTFTQTDEGWTDIYDIKLSADKNGMLDTDGINLLTDLRLVEKEKENDKVTFANPIIYTDKKTVTYSQETNILHAVSAMAKGDPKRGDTTDGTVRYSYERKNGNIEASISEAGVLTVNSGQGVITITQDGVNSGYVLDRKKTDVTVYEKKTVSRNYPYTWDFQNNETTADKFTDDEWIKNTDGSLTLNPKSWNYFEGNDIQTGSSDYAEAQGLGISVPRDKDKSLTLVLGSGLKFGSNDFQILTIPTVPSGFKAYILAKMGDNGSIANGSTTLTGTDYTAGNSNGEKIFVVDGTNGGNIDLKVKNATIEKIGVTGTFKKLNAYTDGKSYATEYRNHNEKYDLTGIFTNGKKVEANVIQEVDNNAHLAKTSSISIAPKETGVILTCSATDGVNAIPLFVKDVNSEESKIESNMLKGTLEETKQLESNGVNYVFTRVSYNLDKDGKIVDSDNGKQSTLGFYRVANNDDSNLAANKAYLHISASNPAKTFYVIEGLFDTNTTTAISNISTADHSAGEEGSYYTLTGIRLNGRPTHAGIYVLNGKKVIIK